MSDSSIFLNKNIPLIIKIFINSSFLNFSFFPKMFGRHIDLNILNLLKRFAPQKNFDIDQKKKKIKALKMFLIVHII